MPSSDYLQQGHSQIYQQLEGISFAQDPDSEAFALTQDSRLCPLLHYELIQISGVDARSFLHHLLSNDVEHLTTQQGQLTSLNTAKGRMLANFILWSEEKDRFLIALAKNQSDLILKKMRMYQLRAKVTLQIVTEHYSLWGICGETIPSHLNALAIDTPSAHTSQITERNLHANQNACLIRLAESLLLLIIKENEASSTIIEALLKEFKPASSNCWHLAMIQAGLAMVTQASQELYTPQMINFDCIGGIHFAKGCYPGQEIIARTHYLGTPKQRLFRLALTHGKADIGTPIFLDETCEQSAGQILNMAQSSTDRYEILAVLRTTCLEQVSNFQLKDYPEAHFELLTLPYAIEKPTK